jgi:hypothetical protein
MGVLALRMSQKHIIVRARSVHSKNTVLYACISHKNVIKTNEFPYLLRKGVMLQGGVRSVNQYLPSNRTDTYSFTVLLLLLLLLPLRQ